MKRFFVFVTLLVMVLVTINLNEAASNKELTDKELVEIYLSEECGYDYDELVITHCDDERISYMTFCEDEVNHCGAINRSYYTHKYE